MPPDPDPLRHYSADEQLLDGRGVCIRAIRADDKRALAEGFRRQSAESAYFRFFGPRRALNEDELVFFTEVDFRTHVALVAELADDATPIGVGRYIVDAAAGPDCAEVAFAVDDVHHGLGVATLLLRHLVRIARAGGIATFTASVLDDNHPMLEVFAHAGLPQQRHRDGPVITLRLQLGESPC